MGISEKDVSKWLTSNPDLRIQGELDSRQREHKFKAQQTTVDGIKFPSKKEAARYMYLTHMQELGVISDLETQPRFILQEPFRDRNGKTHRQIAYTADFRYIQEGVDVVEEVKGGKATQTEAFRIRMKLFIKRYPDIDYRIV